ncbi:hypothetical protein J6590_056736 [Homalodisca vitripennis]|nr:hypothetical protein J6590_056736 [Homalodisca vitripennis]
MKKGAENLRFRESRADKGGEWQSTVTDPPANLPLHAAHENESSFETPEPEPGPNGLRRNAPLGPSGARAPSLLCFPF